MNQSHLGKAQNRCIFCIQFDICYVEIILIYSNEKDFPFNAYIVGSVSLEIYIQSAISKYNPKLFFWSWDPRDQLNILEIPVCNFHLNIQMTH